ncbi:ribonuclease HII [Bacillaceae bacterium SIJ1]|uniref:ribonuclease HII n=1 Tax=Litoribacterium kuwaitense TaxID=1398745 RepID=UPI0013ED9A66|nr:ribonuclease HII [Litoribacterium kuwaitense]NGP44143.1 ribonuclease HII [Litoribacterium kuwaitense]
MSETIHDIRRRLKQQSVTPAEINALKQDQRAGVQRLIQSYERKRLLAQKEAERFEQMAAYEKDLRSQGKEWIAGVDEAGRGPLAGPVVAGAAMLTDDFFYPALNDSKKMSPAARKACYTYIMDNALATGVGIVTAEEIDAMNIYKAAQLAMVKAIENMNQRVDHVLVDAMKLAISTPQTKLIKGDQKSISVAAGSVVAKVTRDELMERMAYRYPQYGFHEHMGYGTKKHLEALKAHGPCELHRKSFQPIKELIEQKA